MARFKPHQRGGGCCSGYRPVPLHGGGLVSNPISGEVGAAADPAHGWRDDGGGVSNPISGEVGAAASPSGRRAPRSSIRFKPHQRGGGCCSSVSGTLSRRSARVSNPISGEVGAAAQRGNPVPQRQLHVSKPIRGEVGAAAAIDKILASEFRYWFQTPSAGRWVLQPAFKSLDTYEAMEVSNPISGEVGAAALQRIAG